MFSRGALPRVYERIGMDTMQRIVGIRAEATDVQDEEKEQKLERKMVRERVG